MHILSLTSENHQYSIFSIYSSRTNSPDESTPYVSADMCPSTVNKWLCAFLPPTNCSYPDELVKCQDPIEGQISVCMNVSICVCTSVYYSVRVNGTVYK